MTHLSRSTKVPAISLESVSEELKQGHRIFCHISAAIVCVLWITAVTAEGAGRGAFPILKAAPDARTFALGGAAATISAWGASASVNPAAPAESDRQVAVSLARHPIDMWSGYIGYTLPVSERQYALTAYYFTMNYGSFDESERGVGKTGRTFTAAEHLFAGCLSGTFGSSFYWGASLKFAWGSIDRASASAAAVDLGMIIDPSWEEFRFGISVRNLGTVMNTYGSNSDELPTELLFGTSKKLRHLPLTLSLTGEFAEKGEGDWTLEWMAGDPGISFSAGGEFELAVEGSERPIFLRIGYRSRGSGQRTGNQDLLAGFTFGVGVPFKSLELDYVYAPMGALGQVHRMGIVFTP